ncbi:isoprenoid synthase domain-containing protein [Naematelia encephala]|uniref:(2E,6E)-farnesyl diphosphate synthase n=1 Tax=Naematelia encephala TaxID=71784 RepID=A0A1Y2BIM9_9TREE|nr:isoprenoid synthase domain-containing protein [Naematelia encephala]
MLRSRSAASSARHVCSLHRPISSSATFPCTRSHSTTSASSEPRISSRKSSAWAHATESAHSVLPPPQFDALDPLSAINAEIGDLKSSLFQLLGSSHPSLDTVAKYYFQAEGKHLRPLIVLLMAQATNGLGGAGWEEARMDARRNNVDDSLTRDGGVLNDWNPEQSGPEPQGAMIFAEPFQIPTSSSSSSSRIRPPLPPALPPLDTFSGNEILPTQRRLASITEMIHVASLLHDDVIDTSPLRRGSPSAPSAFGNKLSILSGDFLLGRASVALARLGSREVVELLATVIANLVEGEVLQLRATSAPETTPSRKGFEEYMRKTYLKTASLMAKSARASVILGGCGTGPTKQGEWVKDVAYGYGRNLGIAFQLIDDALDYLPDSSTLGKPSSGADLRLGLATAPALFAWESNPALGPLILRKFEEPGDVEIAKDMVARSNGLERTIELARKFAGEATRCIERLPTESEATEQLKRLTEKVVERVK